VPFCTLPVIVSVNDPVSLGSSYFQNLLPFAFVRPVTTPLASSIDETLPFSIKYISTKPPLLSLQSNVYPDVSAQGIVLNFYK
jgi:hypothetical protein